MRVAARVRMIGVMTGKKNQSTRIALTWSGDGCPPQGDASPTPPTPTPVPPFPPCVYKRLQLTLHVT